MGAPELASQGVADGAAAYLEAYLAGLRPDAALEVDQWADAYLRIPPGTGPEPGKYRLDRTPYVRAPLVALSPHHPARRVVLMWASQIGKTQLALAFLLSVCCEAPANVLALEPSERVAKRFSARLQKTIQETPRARDRFAPARSRDAANTHDRKDFRGGTLYCTTANSPANLSEVPIRWLYGDEVDRWEAALGAEGSPRALARNRLSAFGARAKELWTSTPVDLHGPIHEDFLAGNQHHAYVPCPHCGHMHVLQWEAMRWEPDYSRAWMVCPACHREIDESAKDLMLPALDFRPHTAGDGLTWSYYLPAWYAPLGFVSWATMAREYSQAKAKEVKGDWEDMRTWTNTRAALPWDPRRSAVPADKLRALAGTWLLGRVPWGAWVLTGTVDVQDDRLELEVVGWGPGLERWTVDHRVIHGSPADPAVWRELDELVTTPYRHAVSGRPLVIRGVGVDTGGHHTQEAYDWCRLHRRRYVGGREQRTIALKGSSRPGRPVIAAKPAMVDVTVRGRTHQASCELWQVGTDTAKDWLTARWLLGSGPGAIHYAADLPDEWYAQAVSEVRKIRFVRGRKRSEWIPVTGQRNEVLDLHVYALAVAHYLELHRKTDGYWERLRAELCPDTPDLFSALPAPPGAAPAGGPAPPGAAPAGGPAPAPARAPAQAPGPDQSAPPVADLEPAAALAPAQHLAASAAPAALASPVPPPQESPMPNIPLRTTAPPPALDVPVPPPAPPAAPRAGKTGRPPTRHTPWNQWGGGGGTGGGGGWGRW